MIRVLFCKNLAGSPANNKTHDQLLDGEVGFYCWNNATQKVENWVAQTDIAWVEAAVGRSDGWEVSGRIDFKAKSLLITKSTFTAGTKSKKRVGVTFSGNGTAIGAEDADEWVIAVKTSKRPGQGDNDPFSLVNVHFRGIFPDQSGSAGPTAIRNWANAAAAAINAEPELAGIATATGTNAGVEVAVLQDGVLLELGANYFQSGRYQLGTTPPPVTYDFDITTVDEFVAANGSYADLVALEKEASLWRGETDSVNDRRLNYPEFLGQVLPSGDIFTVCFTNQVQRRNGDPNAFNEENKAIFVVPSGADSEEETFVQTKLAALATANGTAIRTLA